MKPSDIFELIVRLSGYFAVYFAVYALINMAVGGMPFSFRGFLFVSVNAFAGAVLIKIAPLIKEFAYGSE